MAEGDREVEGGIEATYPSLDVEVRRLRMYCALKDSKIRRLDKRLEERGAEMNRMGHKISGLKGQVLPVKWKIRKHEEILKKLAAVVSLIDPSDADGWDLKQEAMQLIGEGLNLKYPGEAKEEEEKKDG